MTYYSILLQYILLLYLVSGVDLIHQQTNQSYDTHTFSGTDKIGK